LYEKEGIENRILRTKLDKENNIVPNRTELYKNYKVENRTEFWKAINKEIKPLKDREQIRAFISKQMDRILEDKTLMDYINLTEIVEKTKTKTK
jgi:hypothetical protein